MRCGEPVSAKIIRALYIKFYDGIELKIYFFDTYNTYDTRKLLNNITTFTYNCETLV